MKLKVLLITILIGLKGARGQWSPLFHWSESMSYSNALLFNNLNTPWCFSTENKFNYAHCLSIYNTLFNSEHSIILSGIGFQRVFKNKLIGIGWEHIGWRNFRVNQLSFKYQHQLSQQLYLGLLFKLQHSLFPNQETIVEHQQSLFALHSINKIKFLMQIARNTSVSNVQWSSTLGASYQLLNTIQTFYECTLHANAPAIPIIGIRTKLNTKLFLNGGINVNSFNPAFGALLNFNKVSIHFGFAFLQTEYFIPSSTYCYEF